MNDISFKLRLKLLLSLSCLLLMMVVLGYYQFRVLEQTQKNHHLLGELGKLEELSEVLPRRSQNYVNNAARDYESYKRDVKVFFVDILADVKHVDSLVADLTTGFSDNIGYALPSWMRAIAGDAEAVAALNKSADGANMAWKDFRAGFQEKLGDDEQEPRIEWGAEYIIEHSPVLSTSFTSMIAQYREFLDTQAQQARMILKSGMIFVAIYTLLVILWVYLSVFRRIGKTVDACKQVANGNFGYTLSIDGNDELSILARAFNLLSNRSRLVLAMMGDLQQSSSNEDALQTIIQASGGYLPIAWSGLVKMSPSGSGQLVSALPGKSASTMNKAIITNDQDFHRQLEDMLVTRKSLRMASLPEYAGANPQEGFLRQLVRASDVESLLAIPLSSLNGWEGVLLFGTKNGSYRKDHSELLENLSSIIASAFERIEVR